MKEYFNHLENHTTTPSGALIEKCHKILIDLTKSKALNPRLQFWKSQLGSHIDAFTKLGETVKMTKLETSIISQLQEIRDLYFGEPAEWIGTLPIPPKPLTRDFMSIKAGEIIKNDQIYIKLGARYDTLQDYYFYRIKSEKWRKEIFSRLQRCTQDIKDVFRNSAIQQVTRDIKQLWDDISKIDKFDNDGKNPISIRQNFSPMGITEQSTTFDGGNNNRETSLPKKEDLSYLDSCDVGDDSRHVLNRKLWNARIYLNDLIIRKNKLKPNSGKEAEFLEEIKATTGTIKEINFELFNNQTFGALPQINTREKLDRILYAKFGGNFIYRTASITGINPFGSQNGNGSVQTTEGRNGSDASALKNGKHRSTNDHLIDDSTINELNLTHITEIEAEKKMAAVNTLKKKYKKKGGPIFIADKGI